MGGKEMSSGRQDKCDNKKRGRVVYCRASNQEDGPYPQPFQAFLESALQLAASATTLAPFYGCATSRMR
jgi:hypothetical protein